MSHTSLPALCSRGLLDPRLKVPKDNEEKEKCKANSKDTEEEDAREEKSTVKASKVQIRRLAVNRRLAVGEEGDGKGNKAPGKNGRMLDADSD